MENKDIHNFTFNISSTINGVSRKTIEKIVSTWYKTDNKTPLIRPDIPEEDTELLKKQISECILDKKTGDISRHAKSVHLAMIYISLNPEGKEKFLQILAEYFDIDTDAIYKNIKKLKEALDDKEKVKIEQRLSNLLIPPRVKFLKKIISLPNGFIFLKDMRQDLLPHTGQNPRLKKLDNDIKNLLTTYFDVNLLNLIEVNWKSPAALLEKLAESEAVHAIRSWKDLKHRLLHDHKVYAFLHPKMPFEPLIFVEIAFTNGLAPSIQKLLDRKAIPLDPHEADTAIFYSISNAQKGLRGISYGNFLIKRVVRELRAEYKNLKTFSTLSPIPTFMKWLKPFLTESNEYNFKQKEKDAITEYTKNNNAGLGLLEILSAENWHENKELKKLVKKPLLRLCSYFLLNVKRKGTRTYDPVANFHLSNGAKIAQINWLGDTSENGMRQSAGIMVNYKYKLNKIASNHEEYRTTGKIYSSIDIFQ